MTSDLQALLAAVVANPADDAARLVYADCLEEHGNAARATFIRLQIEAERHHPDSPKRAEIEKQAHALFAEHWIGWWGEVCAATGLRPPAPKPTGRLKRLAQWAGIGTQPGDPYKPYAPDPALAHFGVHQYTFEYEEDTSGFSWAGVRRGFPDSLALLHFQPSRRGREPLLSAWRTVAPVAALSVLAPLDWQDATYLEGVSSLGLYGLGAAAAPEALASPHLSHLEELSLCHRRQGEAPDFAVALAAPRAKQLKRLSVEVPSVEAANAIARSPVLAGLDALGIDVPCPLANDHSGTGRLGGLARSPHLSKLRELALAGHLAPDACRAFTQLSWPALRKLTIGPFEYAVESDDELDGIQTALFEVFLGATCFPALDELRIVGEVYLDTELIDAFIASPLMKQLKHFALSASGFNTVSRTDADRLPQMFDLNRIETFAFRPDHYAPGLLDELMRQLGDRLRLPW